MRIFWANGYEAASMGVLSSKTRMPRASIYQQFGDKEGLFLAAIAHYSETRVAAVAAALEGGGDLRSDLGRFFDAVVDLATQDPETPGCLVSCVLADAAGTNPRFREELAQRFGRLEARLEARLDRARDGGASVGAAVAGGARNGEAGSRDRAMFLATVARGLMLRARAGAAPQALRAAARVAIDAVAA